MTRALVETGTLPLRPQGRGLAVTCRAGTLLVTQEGDAVDHVLQDFYKDEETEMDRAIERGCQAALVWLVKVFYLFMIPFMVGGLTLQIPLHLWRVVVNR